MSRYEVQESLYNIAILNIGAGFTIPFPLSMAGCDVNCPQKRPPNKRLNYLVADAELPNVYLDFEEVWTLELSSI
jgi:hypothetical protein